MTAFSSVRLFPDLSLITLVIVFLSFVSYLTTWYALLRLFLFRLSSISLHLSPIHFSLASLVPFLISLLVTLYIDAPSVLPFLLFGSLLRSHFSSSSLVIQGCVIRRSLPRIYCDVSVIAVFRSFALYLYPYHPSCFEWLPVCLRVSLGKPSLLLCH